MTTHDSRSGQPPEATGETGWTDRPVPWSLVIPVKARHLAKTRLHPPPGVRRSDLAHAFALDTLTVAAHVLSAGRLVVVTSDPATQRFARDSQAVVVDDDMEGLNSAIRAGLTTSVGVIGDGPTGVLLGDLPALTVEDLEEALRHCRRSSRTLVPDADGTGTVLLTARRGSDLTPRFGAGSAAAHEKHGHRRLDLDLPRLRTDVDDDVGLARAQQMGLGQHTRAVLAAALYPTRPRGDG